jgi:hypothetical protein
MRPCVAPLAIVALAVLVPSSAARAVPITGYAFGHVVEDLSAAWPHFIPPRTFAFGERVTLRYTYDLDPPDPAWGPRPEVRFEVFTAGGHEQRTDFASSTSVQGDWPDFRLRLAADPWSYDLRFAGGEGTLPYEVDYPNGVAGFRAVVDRTDEFLPVDFPAPEPSTLALGGIGGVLALGYAWRRKRAT